MTKTLTPKEQFTLACQMLDMIERELAAAGKESAAQISVSHDLEQQHAYVALHKKIKMLHAEHETFKAKADYWGHICLAGFKNEQQAKNALDRAIVEAMS